MIPSIMAVQVPEKGRRPALCEWTNLIWWVKTVGSTGAVGIWE